MINFEKYEVRAWAIMTKETRIVCYVDPSVPNFDKVCNDYLEKGFYVVKLYGELDLPEETVTINLRDLKKAMCAYNTDSIMTVAKALGFNRGIK